MTPTENGQREELARDIFITDNARNQDPAALWDEADQEHMHYAEVIADGLIAAGYRKPRTITTMEELAGLMDGTVIIDSEPICSERVGGQWYVPAGPMPYGDHEIILPATVLWEPEAEVGA